MALSPQVIGIMQLIAAQIALDPSAIAVKDMVLVEDPARPFLIDVFEMSYAEAGMKENNPLKAARLKTLDEAQAACKRVGRRVPTEKEWLAAASAVGANKTYTLAGDQIYSDPAKKEGLKARLGGNNSSGVREFAALGIDAIGTVGMTGNRPEWVTGSKSKQCGAGYELKPKDIELVELRRICGEKPKDARDAEQTGTVRCVLDVDAEKSYVITYSEYVKDELRDHIAQLTENRYARWASSPGKTLKILTSLQLLEPQLITQSDIEASPELETGGKLKVPAPKVTAPAAKPAARGKANRKPSSTAADSTAECFRAKKDLFLKTCSECRTLNSDMTAFYSSHAGPRTRVTPSDEARIKTAMSKLGEYCIPPMWSFYETFRGITLETMKELTYQEWMRGYPSEGMPWLPISWNTSFDGSNTYVLYSYEKYGPAFEGALKQLPRPLSDDAMMVGYLFVGSVPHAANTNLATRVRQDALDLLAVDSSPLGRDIRQEAHERPSRRTISRVAEYLRLPNISPSARKIATELHKNLQKLFGGGAISEFLELYSLTPDAKQALVAAEAFIRSPKASAADAAKVLDALAKGAETYAAKVRAGSDYCSASGKEVDCIYEAFDVLHQFQSASATLTNALTEALESRGEPISLEDYLSLATPLLRMASSVGLMDTAAIAEIESFRAVARDGAVTQTAAVNLLQSIEDRLGAAYTDLRGLYLSQISRFKLFSSKSDLFIDETLRMLPTLPLANLTQAVKSSVRKGLGLRLYLADQPVGANFEVFNAGMAKGKLIMPSGDEIGRPGYVWRGDGIYLLPETPAEISKVAGILTAQPGSVISHVSLLARQHGIPNVFVSPSLRNMLAKWEGKEILLLTLPSGEAQIKLWAEATAAQKAVYDEYSRARASQKITLNEDRKIDLSFKSPFPLASLDMSHAGVIAGQKAAGQGELARIMAAKPAAAGESASRAYVPHGIVLPFGSYYAHVTQPGKNGEKSIYQDIQETFTRADVRKDAELRVREMRRITDRIQAIELNKETVDELRELLLGKGPYPGRAQNPFLTYDDKGEAQLRGMFVRSDTNAEDLPGFVGAGLNKTLGNVVGFEKILKAITEVWASPFTEKAFTWREDLINNPWDIFPSVVIQIGMPSHAAGVMVVGSTTNAADQTDHVVIASNQGLGFTLVNGEATPEELLVSRAAGTVAVTRKARAMSYKAFKAGGGIDELPLSSPRARIVPDDVALQMARIGDHIQKTLSIRFRKPLKKWDLEWATIGKRIILLQIREFEGNKIARNLSALEKLALGKNKAPVAKIDMGSPMFVLKSAPEKQ